MKKILLACSVFAGLLTSCIGQNPPAAQPLTLDAATVQELSAPLEAVNEGIADAIKNPGGAFELPKVNLPGGLNLANARLRLQAFTTTPGSSADSDSDGIPDDKTTTYGGSDSGYTLSGSSNLKDKGTGNVGLTAQNTNIRLEKGATFFVLNSALDYTPITNGFQFAINAKYDVGYNGKNGSLEYKLNSSFVLDAGSPAPGGTINYEMVLTIIWDGKTSTLSAKGENLHFSRDCGYSFDAGKTTYTGADGKTLEFTYSGCKRPVSNTPVIDRLSIALVDTSVEVGKTVQYTVQARDSSDNVISGLSYTYSSSDTGKATINSSGLASGVAQGTTTITAATNGRSVSTGLTVNSVSSANFTASVSRTSASTPRVPAGLSAYVDYGGLTITRNGYAGSLTLRLENAPAGVTPLPASVSATSSGGDFGLQVTNATPVGRYENIKLIVVGGGLERRIDLSLTVQ